MGPSNAIPVVEVISVVTPFAEPLLDTDEVFVARDLHDNLRLDVLPCPSRNIVDDGGAELQPRNS